MSGPCAVPLCGALEVEHDGEWKFGHAFQPFTLDVERLALAVHNVFIRELDHNGHAGECPDCRDGATALATEYDS